MGFLVKKRRGRLSDPAHIEKHNGIILIVSCFQNFVPYNFGGNVLGLLRVVSCFQKLHFLGFFSGNLLAGAGMPNGLREVFFCEIIAPL